MFLMFQIHSSQFLDLCSTVSHKISTRFKLEWFSLEKGKVGIKACFFTLFFLYRKCIQVLNILEGI